MAQVGGRNIGVKPRYFSKAFSGMTMPWRTQIRRYFLPQESQLEDVIFEFSVDTDFAFSPLHLIPQMKFPIVLHW